MGYEGTVVGGRFAIDRLAGRGGMGAVYHAVDRQTAGVAAIKILHDGTHSDATERFAREVALLADLTHPGFVRYLGHGTTDEDQPFLAMEWLEGEDLATRLRRVGIGANEAVQVIARVASALGIAHARGVIHRDIKPSTLFLVDLDLARVKILDLGIARLANASSDMTRTGAAIGTPRYMAPEQARGSRDLDARADVFSLGCVLFECFAAHPPFTGDTPMAVLAKILLEDAPRLSSVRPDLPQALEDVVARMLAKEAVARPRDATAVANELAALGEITGRAGAPVRSRDSAVTIGEQRLVCVVFAQAAVAGTGTLEAGDLARDTLKDPTMSANTLAADGAEVVLPALSATVSAHGGRAEVLADGSVVVTVLGQGTATDQAARAARCALAVRDVVPRAAMALAMGRCVVADRVPFGELIDRAASLLGPTPTLQPGRAQPIRVDEISAGLLDIRFAIAGDERSLVLTGERDVTDPARMLLGKPSPCVGRERELAMLSAIFDECIDEPMAHVVVVTAAAGVGKSRLRHEFLHRLAERGVEVWIGRGNPMSAGAPFAMLAQALRRSAGIVDGEPLHVRHSKLKARVTRNVLPGDAAMIGEFLGELVGAPLAEGGSMQLRAARQDPQLMGDQMLRACEDFVAAECAAHPVVLVLEDLQWSDVATVRFVDSILRQLPDRPLMVLALARPEVDATFPRLWADRHVERVALGELTRRAAEKLVREALGERITEPLVARLVERAAGNAFYLEELVRAVAEGKGDQLPETVVAMAQARIEGLEFEARHVLRAASVFGQVFWRGALAALLDGGATRVHDWLDELVRREFVVARRESRFPGEVELSFRHALVREAAYAMLTEKDRRSGHRLAGEWLETRVGVGTLASAADAVILAEHFERGGEPRRSIGWYRQAAAQALESDDLPAAIERAERAIACTKLGTSEDTGDTDRYVIGALRQLQSDAHVWRGEFALAAERASEAMAQLGAGSELWLTAAASRIDALTRLLDADQVIALCRVLGDTPTTPATHRVYAQAVAMTMSTLLWQADAALIARLFGRLDAIADAIAATEPATLAWILHARSWRAMSEGDFGGCLALDTRVVECFEAVGDLRHACQQRANVGYDQLHLGAFSLAETSLRDAVAIAIRLGVHLVSAQALHNLGLALAYQGRLAEAREVETEALGRLGAQGNRRLVAAAQNYLAVIETLAGDYPAAIRCARESIALAIDMPALRTQFEATLSNACRLGGDAREALVHASTALELMEEHGRPEEGEQLTLLAYAEALHATGAHAEARSAIASAELRLLACAARIKDPAWRASFLEAIPENRQTITLARSWC